MKKTYNGAYTIGPGGVVTILRPASQPPPAPRPQQPQATGNK